MNRTRYLRRVCDSPRAYCFTHGKDCFLFPCGFLGSSPDDIIATPNPGEGNARGVLEMKCPWSHRNSTIAEMIKAELKGKEQLPKFYLTATGELNKTNA